ncbi:MAG: pilus motility taxis protein HmpF [Crinalium sp.]
MLYLAEVQKKTSFISGTKTELKLLAGQRTDQSWTAVPGEEVIPAPDEANSYSAGVLVLADLGTNRQIQRPLTEASRQLVNILQNFSRQLEKSKKEEEEIEQWKQSLTYQSQELNRRQIEMERRLEQLQEVEEEFERLERERQEINNSRSESNNLKQELERNRQQLDAAWQQLQIQQQRLDERRAEVEQSAGLDAQQVSLIQELINRIASAIAPTDALREQLHLAFELVNNQQAVLNYNWQQLQEQTAAAQQMQAEVDHAQQDVQNRSSELQQGQASLEETRTNLQLQQQALDVKQASANLLRIQLQNQEEIYQKIHRLTAGQDENKVSQKIDVEALEKIPLGELEAIVQNLQNEIHKFARFVNDQEEELNEKRQTIAQLQSQIASSTEHDRIALESELASEQDGYQLLDKTLKPQRSSLAEREDIFQQHIRVLQIRQGINVVNPSDNQKIDLEPILTQLAAQRQQLEEQLQQLENQIAQITTNIEQAQGIVADSTSKQEARKNELQALQQNLQNQLVTVAELRGKVNLYQETLPHTQDHLNWIRQKLEAIESQLNHIQETGNYQVHTVDEMQQLLNNFMGV